jgi:Sulfotransferase family
MIFTERHEQDLAEIKAQFQGQLELITQIEERLAPQERPPSAEVAENGGAPLYAFVHIPKTAGGTVTSMLAGAYSKSGLHKAGNYMKGGETAEKKVTKRPGGWESFHRRGGRVSVGHVPFGVFQKHLPPDTQYMTFLREPVDRALSHYHRHIRRRDPRRAGRPAKHGRVRADSLEEAVVELRMPQLNNLATRFLCDNPTPGGDLSPTALDEAKANLSRFAFIGIQERFLESVILLQRALGMGSVPYEDRHVSSDRPAVEELPPEERALLAEHNQLDAELYSLGLELFEKAVAAADDGFQADVEALRASSASQ